MTVGDLARIFAEAQVARRDGRKDDARRGFAAIVARAPDHVHALNALGILALEDENSHGAAGFIARAIAVDPHAPELRMNLARAHRLAGDAAAERAALDAALTIDQRHFMALVRLAELHERLNEQGAAAERWSAVAALAAQAEPRTPALDALHARATDYLARRAVAFGAAMDDALADARDGVAPADRRRIDACIDVAVGRRRIFVNECAGLHVPFLPADEFFDDAHFPWFATLRAEWRAIRAELEALLRDDAGAIDPYVSMAPGIPANKWTPLDGSLAWGAMHLWKDGRRIASAVERCPHTARVLETLPLCEMPDRTPTAFFSILRPGTRLPAHSGVSNARAIVHLPLIIPPGCGFRVGGETRPWVEGEPLVFDDTIEHEAWNGSDEIRALLIFDIWNPYLTVTEQGLLRRFFSAADATGYGPQTRVGDV